MRLIDELFAIFVYLSVGKILVFGVLFKRPFERPNGCRDLSVWEQEEDARGNETDFSDT